MTLPTPHNTRLATAADVQAIRKLVNDAYQELANMGLNFTGTYQDDKITHERMQNAEVYMLHRDDELIASINVSVKDLETGNDKCLFINQLAVRPDQKRRGLGSYLLDLAEDRARQLGITRLRLDTAIPAKHLVEMYQIRGYSIIEEVQWEGKSYRSYIMEKRIDSTTLTH